MQFIKSEGTAQLEAALISSINNALSLNQQVLWLVPGGSNISVAVKVMKNLDETLLKNLKIMLTDERFGAPGHPDSNYEQLRMNGFNFKSATFNNILSSDDVKDVTRQYSQEAIKAFNEADIVIGFFGMGPDGHIAGILPHSPASTAGKVWAEYYETEPFIRVTLTPYALSHLNKAFVGAFGEAKLEALNNLMSKSLTVTEQPARILCHIPEVTVYNDQLSSEGDK